jgi:hypothetical protein
MSEPGDQLIQYNSHGIVPDCFQKFDEVTDLHCAAVCDAFSQDFATKHFFIQPCSFTFRACVPV